MQLQHCDPPCWAGAVYAVWYAYARRTLPRSSWLTPDVGTVVTVLNDEQIRTFANAGWIVVPRLVAPELLDAMDGEVERLVTEKPPPTGHVGHHFYWPSPRQAPAFFESLDSPGGILSVGRDLVGDSGLELAFDQAQVALNIPSYLHRPARPHIDGYAPDQRTPGTFTLLAGLMLTDQIADNVGNLWVWPGTHLLHAAFFAERGPEAFSDAGGYPDIELPEPVQVHGQRGDVLLAHYLLGHNIGGNYETDGVRRAVYWRLRVEGHAARWRDCLGDPWLEYSGVRRQLEPTDVS
jgi:hypothetical protein